MKPAKILAAVLGVLVALTVVRETGMVTIELDRHGLTYQVGANLTDKERLDAANLEVSLQGEGFLHTGTFQRGAPETLQVTARFTHLDVDGWTWVPLYKRATVHFEVEITTSEPSIGGSVEGSMEVSSLGPRSRRAFLDHIDGEVHSLVLQQLGFPGS
jgi:hypothetical protein